MGKQIGCFTFFSCRSKNICSSNSEYSTGFDVHSRNITMIQPGERRPKTPRNMSRTKRTLSVRSTYNPQIASTQGEHQNSDTNAQNNFIDINTESEICTGASDGENFSTNKSTPNWQRGANRDIQESSNNSSINVKTLNSSECEELPKAEPVIHKTRRSMIPTYTQVSQFVKRTRTFFTSGKATMTRATSPRVRYIESASQTHLSYPPDTDCVDDDGNLVCLSGYESDTATACYSIDKDKSSKDVRSFTSGRKPTVIRGQRSNNSNYRKQNDIDKTTTVLNESSEDKTELRKNKLPWNMIKFLDKDYFRNPKVLRNIDDYHLRDRTFAVIKSSRLYHILLQALKQNRHLPRERINTLFVPIKEYVVDMCHCFNKYCEETTKRGYNYERKDLLETFLLNNAHRFYEIENKWYEENAYLFGDDCDFLEALETFHDYLKREHEDDDTVLYSEDELYSILSRDDKEGYGHTETCVSGCMFFHNKHMPENSTKQILAPTTKSVAQPTTNKAIRRYEKRQARKLRKYRAKNNINKSQQEDTEQCSGDKTCIPDDQSSTQPESTQGGTESHTAVGESDVRIEFASDIEDELQESLDGAVTHHSDKESSEEESKQTNSTHGQDAEPGDHIDVAVQKQAESEIMGVPSVPFAVSSDAFDLGTYRMDNQMAVGKCKKGSKKEAKQQKIKRRGIPNKHLQKANTYLPKYSEPNECEELVEEFGNFGIPENYSLQNDATSRDRIEDKAQTPIDCQTRDTLDARGGVKEEDLQMDMRHHLLLPLDVIIKKKGEYDDLEERFSGVNKSDKKNKNRKKAKRQAQTTTYGLNFSNNADEYSSDSDDDEDYTPKVCFSAKRIDDEI